MRFSPFFALAAVLGVALASAGYAHCARAHVADRTKGKANPDAGLFEPNEGFFKRGPVDERTLALTFDDGPHPGCGEALLDKLRELDVRATFFVVGKRVQARPDLVRRMIAEGHEVGNHTEDHIRLYKLPPAEIARELLECERDVRRATGHGMAFMRPPGMHFTPSVLNVADFLGYITVDVNNVAGDYPPGGGVSDLTPEEAEAYGLQPEAIVAKVERQFKPGTIVLLHDNPITLAALPEIVARARAQGYRFVTTSEMLASLPEPVRVEANPVRARR